MSVAGNDSRIVIWNLSSGEMLQEICTPSAGFISCLAWIKLADRDEDSFVFGASDGNIHLYQRTNENPVFCFLSITLAHAGALEFLEWDPHHHRLASVGDSEVHVWKVSPDESMYCSLLFPLVLYIIHQNLLFHSPARQRSNHMSLGRCISWMTDRVF